MDVDDEVDTKGDSPDADVAESSSASVKTDQFKPFRHTVNIVNYKYPAVKKGMKYWKWKTTMDDEAKCTMWWTDKGAPGCTALRELMKKKIAINHFPGMNDLGTKCGLARTLVRARQKFPDDFSYTPNTWTLPADQEDLKTYLKNNSTTNKGTKKKTWLIVKPDASCQGRGIYLTCDMPEYDPEAGNVVVQTYLAKPYLIGGYKFDLRIYVLVSTVVPTMRIFIYREGLVRFCTEPYNRPTKENADSAFMHLTNYAINKMNDHGGGPVADTPNEDVPVNCPVDGFLARENPECAAAIWAREGYKWSLSTLFRYFAEKGHDVETLWKRICDIIIKTELAVASNCRHLYKSGSSEPNGQMGFQAFELQGYDIVLDSNFNPIMLEVNQSPSLHSDAELDRAVKEPLLRETFALVGAKPPAGVVDAELVEWRNQYDAHHCHGFIKLYPVEGPSFEKYQAIEAMQGSLLRETTSMTRRREELERKKEEKAAEEAKIQRMKQRAKKRFNRPKPNPEQLPADPPLPPGSDGTSLTSEYPGAVPPTTDSAGASRSLSAPTRLEEEVSYNTQLEAAMAADYPYPYQAYQAYQQWSGAYGRPPAYPQYFQYGNYPQYQMRAPPAPPAAGAAGGPVWVETSKPPPATTRRPSKPLAQHLPLLGGRLNLAPSPIETASREPELQLGITGRQVVRGPAPILFPVNRVTPGHILAQQRRR